MNTKWIWIFVLAGLCAGCTATQKMDVAIGAAAVYTGYDAVERQFKPHHYAPPGVRLDDYIRAIEEKENEKTLDGSLTEKRDHLFCYYYEGKSAVYLGRFRQLPRDPEASAATFSSDDIWNPESLARKLSAPTDPVSAYLASRLPSKFNGPPGEQALRQRLAGELNSIIDGPLIYNKDRFRNVALRPMVTNALRLDHVPPQLQEKFNISLNRMLLEDAYPFELVERERIDYTHWYISVRH